MNYAFEHAGAVYTPNPNGPGVTNVNAHNDALEAAELAQWATAPDRFAGYIVGHSVAQTLETWRGKRLGVVTEYRLLRGRSFGARMWSVRVRGNNGATYYGRYGADNSQLVRLRKVKAK